MEAGMRRVVLLLALLALAACGKEGSTGPWLTDPGVNGHAKFFPLAGTPHDPTAAGTTVTCNACHPGTTFAQFDCITCHTGAKTDPLHAGVGGYTYTSAGCYSCHPNGSVAPPPDHDTKFFPRGTGSAHASVYCSQCHTDLTQASNPTNFACATCHAGLSGFTTAHAAVTGVNASTTSAQCLECHGDSQVDKVASHTKFPIAAGSSTHDTVCLQCHTSLRGDKPFAADFSKFDCTACHAKPATDSAHTGIAGYVYSSPSCYGCHPTGSGAPANHDAAFFPISTGTAHAGIACTSCHTDLANPTNPSNFACASCHLGLDAALVTKHTSTTSNPAIRVASSEISTTGGATCLRCHADSQVSLTSSHPTGSEGMPPHQGARCLQCHSMFRTDKPFGADFATNPASSGLLATRQGCYTCHDAAPPGGN
jgi:hypothetical protein